MYQDELHRLLRVYILTFLKQKSFSKTNTRIIQSEYLKLSRRREIQNPNDIELKTTIRKLRFTYQYVRNESRIRQNIKKHEEWSNLLTYTTFKLVCVIILLAFIHHLLFCIVRHTYSWSVNSCNYIITWIIRIISVIIGLFNPTT